MKIAIVASYAPSILNFKKELVVELSTYFQVKVFAPYENEQTTQAILELGAEYCAIPMSKSGINPFVDVKLMRCLISQFNLFKPDQVLSYTIKPVIWGSIAAKKAGVPNIFSMITGLGYAFTEVGTLKRKLIQCVVKWLYKKALRYNKLVFFQNTDDLQLFKQLKLISLSKKVIMLNGSGVNLSHFALAPLPRERVFLLIARLLKDKGIYEYIEAARKIKKDFPETKFLMAGWIDANPSAIKKSELDALIKEGIIEYKGKLDDVRPAIAEASVYVLPSYREGIPRSVLEAMSMGRPIITTDAPGCRETVVDGLNGFLVPIKNVDKLVEVMEKFILYPELVIAMGKESRKIAEEKYDVHKVKAVILKALEV